MPEVRLEPMSDEDLAAYLEVAIPDYAEENLKNGRGASREEALASSRSVFGTLLPAGIASPGQHVFSIVDAGSGDKVGMIWFGVREEEGHGPFAFIWDFRIDPECRGGGYGSRALLALEAEVRQAGLREIYLHAFGHNEGAIRLYERTGYRIKDVLMGKDLGGDTSP